MNEPQFTASHGRKFALTLAIAFGVIAAIAFWRGRQTASWIAGTIALVMSLAGLLVPGSLEPVERGWMKLAHAISRVTTPIFMGIVYFVILTPVGVVRRIMGANALVHRPNNGSYWIRRLQRDKQRARRQMERQF
jgi:hypothetical protein